MTSVVLMALLNAAPIAPSAQEATKMYGDSGSHCVLIDSVEYGLDIGKIAIHADAEDSLRSVLHSLAANALIHEIKTYHGGYNSRNVRGTKYKSVHTWCLALDFNAGKDGWSKDFLDVWKSHGWAWGGDFSRKKDPMHFSAAPWEGASIKVKHCPKVRRENTSGLEWNSEDSFAEAHASRSCQKMTGAECLVKFTKTGYKTYQALCGYKR